MDDPMQRSLTFYRPAVVITTHQQYDAVYMDTGIQILATVSETTRPWDLATTGDRFGNNNKNPFRERINGFRIRYYHPLPVSTVQ